MSEHSSKPHEFVSTFMNDWCGYGLGVENACAKRKSHPIHAQAEPKPLEIAEKWRNLNCASLRMDAQREKIWVSPAIVNDFYGEARPSRILELIEELSQAQQRIASLEAELENIKPPA
jgi:iron-sulfur cluster repair protein YtfE (RIC family)